MANKLRQSFCSGSLLSAAFCSKASRMTAARYFSTSNISQAPGREFKPGAAQNSERRLRLDARGKDRSRQVRQMEMFLKEMPTDAGMLAGTLIMPTGKNLPSIWWTPGTRLRLEFRRAWKRLKDFVSIVVIYKFQASPRLPIQFRSLSKHALDLHEQMYLAFSDHNFLAIRIICCDGLAGRLRGRINTRIQKHQSVLWKLHSLPKAQVISHRASPLPIPNVDQLDGLNAIRQAVVRIESKQSLACYKQGVLVKGSDEVKDIVEYLVIQQRCLRGELEDWKVWGTAEESKLEEMDEIMNPTMPTQTSNALS